MLRLAAAAAALLATLAAHTAGTAPINDVPARAVRVSGQNFVLTATGEPIVMAGPNVVVKAAPYMPAVTGSTICNDVVNDECTQTGTCKSCETFNQADVDHLKSLGWNAIRLGVVWAGAQPTDADALDPAFLTRLHALLNLTDANGIYVVLDNHGDMVTTAGCGNGVPMWVAQKAAPALIGKPLVSDFPYNIFQNVNAVPGYDVCGGNATAWAEHAGDPNYNLLNRCCLAMNGPNPGGLGYTSIAQATMDYVFTEGPGRDLFVRFWEMMAEAAAPHPSAVAAELMNEPMSIKRDILYETWQACAVAINAIVPDMAVSLADVGEGAIIPAWIEKIDPTIDIPASVVTFIKQSKTLYYAWHWYGNPSTPEQAVANVQVLMEDWNVPSFATEFGDCHAWVAAAAANISHSYWHYSSYCTTGPSFGNRTVPTDTFGGCMLGWAGGNSSKCV